MIRKIKTIRNYFFYGILALISFGCEFSDTPIGGEKEVLKEITYDSSKKKNILLIVADDLGFADLGVYGSEIDTPNIDMLANSGLLMTNFHTSMTCSPTRAMLLSGQDAHKVGLGVMMERMSPLYEGKWGYEGYLHSSVETIAEKLSDLSYHTYMTGKWHLGSDLEHNPFSQGFEKSFALADGGAGHFGPLTIRDPETIGRSEPIYFEDNAFTKFPKNVYSSQFYTEKIISYIDENKGDGKPFFAYLAFTAPHWPLQAPQKTIDKYKGRHNEGYDVMYNRRLETMSDMGVFPDGASKSLPRPKDSRWLDLTEEEKKYEARRMDIHAAMVDEMDHYIGKLITYLKSTGQYENTLIVFMSDNGVEGTPLSEKPPIAAWPLKCCDNSLENMGKPNSFISLGPNWARVSSGPLRMFKGRATEGGTRVPMILHAPYLLKNKELVHQFITVLDIAPTFLQIASGENDQKYQGKSLLPLLTDVSEKIHSDDYEMGVELTGYRSIRKGDWKLLWDKLPHGGKYWELYNITKDPSEKNDLSKTKPEVYKRMLAVWEKYHLENNIILPE